ncbi:hypothetical protein ES705_46587 [subsurface metagenome]
MVVDEKFMEFTRKMAELARVHGVLWDHRCPKCGLYTVRFRDGTEMTWPET